MTLELVTDNSAVEEQTRSNQTMFRLMKEISKLNRHNKKYFWNKFVTVKEENDHSQTDNSVIGIDFTFPEQTQQNVLPNLR